MQHEFLLEIGTEEIPAGYIRPALESIKEIMGRKLAEFSLAFTDIKTVATPRRLSVCVTGLADRQADRLEEILGPPRQAAFDKDNKPTKAALGFARSRGATVDDIEITTTAKGEYLLLRLEKKGRETALLLAEFIPELINSIPFPKSMHWGAYRTAFARPIQWLLAIFSGKVIECRLDDIKSSDQSRGHRFLAPESFVVTDFADYIAGLKRADVIVDPAERRKLVIEEINRAAADVGGRIIPDDELLDTVTNLVELPVGVCGGFAEKFLSLPGEVLITSMRVHQKSFPVADNNGDLMANFVAVNNTRVKNPALTRQGHERVLRARLEDALFFFEEDCRKPLEQRLEKLNGVVFQAKLGTMLEKTERLVGLAKFLAEKLNIPTISTGQLLRDEVKKKSALGKQISNYLKKGVLVPNHFTNKLVKERLSQKDCRNGFILDGFPRIRIQAKFLDSLTKINYVFFIKVSDKEVKRRLAGRRTCPKCGRVYNLEFNPPKKDNICDVCGSKLEIRADDTPSGIRQRLKIYHSETEEVIEYYKNKNLLFKINGEQSIEKVKDEIFSILF